MFRTVPLSIIRSFHCTHSNGICHTALLTACEQDQDGVHYFLKFIFGIKLYMFRTVPLSILRSFSLYTQQWYMSYRFVDSLRGSRTFEMTYVLVCFWRDSPQWARASSFTKFLDHTQWRSTVGKTSLDEWSARPRDLYLTTHGTHDKHPCPQWDSNPQSQ